MTTVTCLACLYPESHELHTCGKAVAFPAEADTLGSGRTPVPPMDHFFGNPEDGQLGVDERYCTEPRIPGSTAKRTYHVTFEMESGGNFICTHCGEHFLEKEKEASTSS